MSSGSQLRFGILGTARIVRRIVAEMQATDGIKVTAIASRDANRASWYAQQYGVERSLGSYQELLDSDLVDAVYIPLPPSLHGDWSIAAAKAGKHVLCEKPLSIDLPSAMGIADACRDARVCWMDATAWLHHERTAAMRQVVDSQLGIVQHITSAVSFFEPFQTDEHRLDGQLGGGCLLDLGWYAAGVALWAVGSVPEVVAATGSKRGDVWYRVTAMIRWPCGTTGTIHCGFDISSRKWFEIAGDQRSLVCDDFTRPWADRPARYWLHDRAGTVQKQEFLGIQERAMFESFRRAASGEFDLAPLNRQAMATQQFIAAIESKLLES